jgi:hypothetical protein
VEAAPILVDELGDRRSGAHQAVRGVVARSQEKVSDLVRQRAAHDPAEDAVAGEGRSFVDTRSEQHRRLDQRGDRVRVEPDRRRWRPIDEIDRAERVGRHASRSAVGDRNGDRDGCVTRRGIFGCRFLNLHVVRRPDRGRLLEQRRLELRSHLLAVEHEIDPEMRRRHRLSEQRQQKDECDRRHMASPP